MKLEVGAGALGISEHAWRSCAALSIAPPIAWGMPRHAVVVAPHPDDEVLAVGGAMRELARHGARLTIVAVTDGEASHPRSPTVRATDLSAIRAAERRTALAALGLAARVVRLGYPDGRVANDDHSDASHGTLARRLARELGDADLCLAPWQLDGHPDHDACGRAAIAACRATGARLLRYPVWAWHWAAPSGELWPWPQLRRISLDSATLAAKRAAIAAYRSQIAPLSPAPGDEPILPREVLARFERPFEVVLV